MNDIGERPELTLAESGIVEVEASELGSAPEPALSGLGLGNEAPANNPSELDTGPSIPRKAIISWLVEVDAEIAATVEQLRADRPHLFTHPLKRLRYVGEIAVQAGKRQLLNQAARRLIGEHEDLQ